jgi:hypothetical protein
MKSELTAQKVGAFGERAVEAELLRRGWIPANVNPTLKNAADYDIFAYKDPTEVHIRVKTCGPFQPGFQFGGFNGEIETTGIRENDFTILVRMGRDRVADQFYVVPTLTVRNQLKAHRKHYLETPKRDGQARKDLGHWTMHLADLRSGEDRPSHGLARRWAQYLGKWELLERGTKRPKSN